MHVSISNGKMPAVAGINRPWANSLSHFGIEGDINGDVALILPVR